jgi:hypothetical protein
VHVRREADRLLRVLAHIGVPGPDTDDEDDTTPPPGPHYASLDAFREGHPQIADALLSDVAEASRGVRGDADDPVAAEAVRRMPDRARALLTAAGVLAEQWRVASQQPPAVRRACEVLALRERAW